MNIETFRQACNGCDTIDYDGELNEAGVCEQCSSDPDEPSFTISSDVRNSTF